MPEPFTFDQLASHPIMGTWSVEDCNEEYSGFLYRDGDNLHLTLYFTGSRPFDLDKPGDHQLAVFAPPNQPTVRGRTKTGNVTLFNCAQIGYQSSNQLNPPQARVELTLRPAQAWIGGGFVSIREKI
jgi:ApeA N-terminal domain 1